LPRPFLQSSNAMRLRVMPLALIALGLVDLPDP